MKVSGCLCCILHVDFMYGCQQNLNFWLMSCAVYLVTKLWNLDLSSCMTYNYIIISTLQEHFTYCYTVHVVTPLDMSTVHVAPLNTSVHV